MNNHAHGRNLPGILLLAALLFLGVHPSVADTVTLAWEPPPEGSAIKYRIYRAKNISIPFVAVATTDSTYARLTTPGSAEGHLYYVTAVSVEGVESSPSNVIEIGKTLGVIVEPDRLTFQWNDARYWLETAPSPQGPWTLYTTNSPAFSDTTQPMGFFRLRDQ